MRLSIIIPTLNEAKNIHSILTTLQPLRGQHEIILVDGGSTDSTIETASPLVDKVISSQQGRAMQMNTGSQQATGDVLWFLHGDSLPPENAAQLIEKHLIHPRKHWGRFDVRLSGQHFMFRIIERLMNIRSCITGIDTGDQGIFIKQDVFEKLYGYKPKALMEDIDISKRLLKQFGRPACINKPLITSSRRWEKHGIVKTILLMWQLRLAYFLGSKPDALARRYTNH